MEQGRPIEGLITVACCNTCHYPQTDRLTSYLLITHDGTAHTITCVIFLLDSPRIFVIAIPNHRYDSLSRSIEISLPEGCIMRIIVEVSKRNWIENIIHGITEIQYTSRQYKPNFSDKFNKGSINNLRFTLRYYGTWSK